MSVAKVNLIIAIDNVTHHVTGHPATPQMAYGQEGRQATVYQLLAESGEKCALKVFKPRFRLPSLVGLAEKLAPFASLPGLAACQRTMLIPQRHGGLLQQHPDLLYAALMPWIDGATWHDVVAERKALTPAQSLAIARSFLDVLVSMEQEGIAHCDLSGPNVIIDGLDEESLDENALTVALVDVEQLHAPGLKQPAELAAGSLGYAHRTAENGLWQPEADRFAAAVMLAEMLGWCDERIRDTTSEESYFDPDEMQQAGERAALLKAVLQEQWREGVVSLFERAWQSDVLADCPTMGEWLLALQGIENQAHKIDPHTLLIEAGRLEGEGNLVEALVSYKRALANSDAGSALHAEIQLIIADLQEKQQQETGTLALEQEAAGLAQAERWSEATAMFKTLLVQTIDPDQQKRWQTEAVRCEGENELAGLFDDGLAAFGRQDWSAARELLTAVVTRRPEYTRQGQDAVDLLARIPDHPEPATPPGPRWPIWVAGMAAIVVIALLLLLGAANGGFALFAQAATETPTMTLANTRGVNTPIPAIQTATATLETIATVTATPGDTPKPVATHTLTPAHTITSSPSPTASSTATPTATNTNTPVPVVVAPLRLIAPQHGIYQNPFTFEWQSSPNESYQVRLRNVDSGHIITSDWLQASSWTIDLPGEQFGNWEWQVVARNGRVSELGTFVFDPFPNRGTQFSRFDFNEDCRIDRTDLDMILAVYDTTVPPTDPRFDLNGNGKIDFMDVSDVNNVLREDPIVYCTLP